MEEHFDVLWNVFAGSANELENDDFVALVTLFVEIRFSLRTSRLVFHRSKQAISSFCASIKPEKEEKISRQELRAQLIDLHRLSYFFGKF